MKWEILLVLLFSFTLVSAANLGISPAKINFDNVLRGGYAKGSVSIVIDSENPMTVEVEPTGDIASWLNTSEKYFNISVESPHYLSINLDVPEDIPNGNYTGYIQVKIYSSSSVEDGHIVGKIESNVKLKTTVEVVDIELTDCRVSNTQISDVEKGDKTILTLDIENNGNVRISPTITTNIWNSDQTKIIQTSNLSTEEIFPTTRQKFTFELNTEELSIDQYWLDVGVPKCSYSSVKTFDILEEGTLSAKGVILEIISERNAVVGEIIPINVGFKNIGEKSVTAKFLGEISRDGKVVKILESDEIEVQKSNVEEFKLYFTPESRGNYTISGRVYYEGKRTYEKSLKISASSKSSSKGIVYSILTIVMIALIYGIYREKRARGASVWK